MAGLLAGALAVLAAPFAATSHVVSVTRAPDGGGARVHIEATVEASVHDVERVLGDYGRYPDWFPSMRTAVHEPAGVLHATFQLPWPLKTVRERMLFVRQRAVDTVLFRWRQLDGDFVRNEGTWAITPAGPGRTHVRYDALVQFRRWVPTWMVRRAETKAAPRMMQSIESRASGREAQAR